MKDLAGIRTKFITAASILGLTCLILLVYLVRPGASGPQPAALEEQYKDLSGQVALWQKSNPDKVREDLKQLYSESVLGRFSQISQRMEKLIQESGVTVPAIHYPADSADKIGISGIQEVKIETTVTGEYPKVARFINALEQDKVFFIIDKISLSGQEGGIVSLAITIDTFLKEGA